MPTYAYACADCGHAFDIVQSFSDDTLTVCPECAGNLRKQFNSVGVVFKGSGFYRNDSRAGNGSAGANGKPKTAANGESGSSDSGSKADATPATAGATGASGTSSSGTASSSGSSTGAKSTPAVSTAS